MAYWMAEDGRLPEIKEENVDDSNTKVVLCVAVLSLLNTMVSPSNESRMLFPQHLISHCCSVYGTKQKFVGLPAV